MPRATQLIKTRTRHEILPPQGDEEKGMDPYADGTEIRLSVVHVAGKG